MLIMMVNKGGKKGIDARVVMRSNINNVYKWRQFMTHKGTVTIFNDGRLIPGE